MLRSLVLYTALALGANLPAVASATPAGGAQAAQPGPVDWQAARDAGLPKLVESSPAPVPDVPFSDIDGGTHSLADYRGKLLLVNFWATWCAPCREEMPSLDALQRQMGDEDFAVLTIASGRNPPPAIRKFFEESAITDLPTLTDPTMALARAFGVMAMPVSVLVDADGNEIARMSGDADWASPAALALIAQLKPR
ncbi:TlpA disulfide reductase family protein [Paracoccus luteus]|uniref:TlpA disulfide reductase family protein n=1 Tax=Paracoccus luteus TaxID=2508543 RepID=UPI0010702079|nr:TlpA disulfide reductase family protein [Paracoccus luteus]